MSGKMDGLDLLRQSLETVASDLEKNDRRKRPAVPPLVWAVAASIVLVALLAGYIALNPAADPEVDVMVLKVRGKPVKASLVEGAAPGTIIIVPCRQQDPPLAPVSATVLLGGVK